MKKALSLVLAVVLMLSMATIALADNTTTLTTTVPAATYTLNIPADQKIEFGATETNIGNITVTDASGFAEGKNLKVSAVYDAFKCEGVSTTIPFTLGAQWGSSVKYHEVASGGALNFHGDDTGAVTKCAQIKTTSDSYFDVNRIYLEVNSTDWGKALAGEYTAVITYTCEVVVE